LHQHPEASYGRAVEATDWTLARGDAGLKLTPSKSKRALGSKQLTWASLLYRELSPVEVFVLYFPSRFDLPVDAACTRAVETFGANTGASTSVNFWDPSDPRFSDALALFGIKQPPALVLATGLKIDGMRPQGPEDTPLYALAFTDQAVLSDDQRLATAVNRSHEVLVRGDPQEIAKYVRGRTIATIVGALFHGAAKARDELLKLNPTITVPGGVSLRLG
jgi:hypothetical protein